MMVLWCPQICVVQSTHLRELGATKFTQIYPQKYLSHGLSDSAEICSPSDQLTADMLQSLKVKGSKVKVTA